LEKRIGGRDALAQEVDHRLPAGDVGPPEATAPNALPRVPVIEIRRGSATPRNSGATAAVRTDEADGMGIHPP